jgi:hypothetical protein
VPPSPETAGARGGGPLLLGRRLRPCTVLAAVLVALVGVDDALAHGDPASHYLEAEQLYPAFANRPSQAVELELLGLLQASERRGYPIKVALVSAEGDLTDDPAMLGQPQRYAEFVHAELGPGVRAPVVVVTPFGFGVAGPRLGRARAHSLVRGLDVPRVGGGDALARAAMAAVRQIARAAGRPLPADVPPAPMLASSVGSSRGAGSASSDLAKAAALFGVTFLVLWLSFEVWSRRGRRQAASHARRTPRRTAPANAPLPRAPRSSGRAASRRARRGAPPPAT